jgi:hypothetical protein
MHPMVAIPEYDKTSQSWDQIYYCICIFNLVKEMLHPFTLWTKVGKKQSPLHGSYFRVQHHQSWDQNYYSDMHPFTLWTKVGKYSVIGQGYPRASQVWRKIIIS